MKSDRPSFWREHPLFWGGLLTAALLLGGATWTVRRYLPRYQQETVAFNRQMNASEQALQRELLATGGKRAELGMALLRRDLRLRQLEQKKIHLAISLDDSLLTLRNGTATLRRARLRIGPDSTIRAADGRVWRYVRPVGQRYVRAKRVSPVYEVPEWVYAGRGEAVPPVEARRIEGALGRYVLVLDDGTEVYSAPTAGPFKDGGPKPASFMASAADLEAIFNNVRAETPVFIY